MRNLPRYTRAYLFKRNLWKKRSDQAVRIRFIHMPKCAGMSIRSMLFNQALKQGYGKEEILIPGESHHLRFDSMYKDIAQIKRYKIIAGHYFPKGIVKTDFSFTLLREPVDRFISQYYYFQQFESDSTTHSKSLSQLSESEFNELKPLGNMMTKWLCGQEKDQSGVSVDQAMDVLTAQLTGYGLLEELALSFHHLNQKKMGFDLSTPLHLNQGHTQPVNETNETRELITQINAMDIELYQQAKQHFLNL